MTVLDDLLRHQAAREVLRNPDSSSDQRDTARRTLGLPVLEHGRSKYVNDGCRCGVCRADNAAYFRHHRQFLAVTCWCESQVVSVSPDELADGLTRSCGRRGCSG